MLNRLGKGISAGFASLILLTAPLAAQEFVIDDLSMIELFSAISADSLETLACLTGGEARDSVFVSGVVFKPKDREKRRVYQDGDCPDNTVAAFHSHPWNGPRHSEGINTPFDACFLGPNDLAWLKDLHPGRMAVVGVGNFTYDTILVCWFTKEQIEKGLGGRPWIQSIEGQRWVVEVTEEEEFIEDPGVD